MQPRQRSKCCATVAFSVIVPSSRASMRWMRPRGESISSLPEHVRRAGRQAEAAVDAVGRSARGSRREDSARVELAADRARASAAERPSESPCDDVARGVGRACTRRPARRGRPPRRASARTRCELARREAHAAARGAPGARATRPRPRRRPPRRRRARARPRAAPRPRAPSPRRAPRPARDGGGRARSAGAASGGARATTARGVVGLDDERPRRLRQRVQPEARARDQREASRASRRRAARGRSRRRSSRPCRPRSRSSRRASTSVTPRTRSRGAPKRCRSGPESSSASSAPTVGSPGGSSESRWPCCARARRCSADSRMPASTVHVRSPGSCSRIRSRPVGRQVVADPQPAALARAPRRATSARLLEARDARQRRSSRAGGCGTARAPRRRGAASGSPCPGCRARPGRTRAGAARTTARSRSENIRGIEHALSMPTPCSPVSEPPASRQASRIASASSRARSVSPGLGVVEDERVEVAVARRGRRCRRAGRGSPRAPRSAAAPRAAACAGRRRPGRSSRSRSGPSPRTPTCGPSRAARARRRRRPRAARTRRSRAQIRSTSAASSSTCSATPSSSTRSTAPAPAG